MRGSKGGGTYGNGFDSRDGFFDLGADDWTHAYAATVFEFHFAEDGVAVVGEDVTCVDDG